MGKKSKNSVTTQTQWKRLKIDFVERKIDKDDVFFEEVSDEQLNDKIIVPLFTSSGTFEETIGILIQWQEYLKSRSDRLSEVFLSKVNSYFEHIRITLALPFDESKWAELETLTETDLNKTPIFINNIRTSTVSVILHLENLIKSFHLNVKSAEIFPFDSDSFGLPPINCRKILNPLLWMKAGIEKLIQNNCQCDQPPIVPLITLLDLAPKEGHFQELAIASFFLENTAHKLDYSCSDDEKKFLDQIKMKFGTTKVDKLTMVLPDILMAYSEELVERVMPVSYFIPFELFRMMLLSWQPKVLNLRLRTEACSSIEDAARIEWDDEDVFTSTTLFNCPLFDRCEPVCLGDEEIILNCKLIVDCSGSRLFDPMFNEGNVYTAGRDFLVLFPMQTIILKRIVPLKVGSSVKVQLKKQIDYIVNTFFFNASEHQDRVVNYELTFTNSTDVQMSAVKRCIPQVANGRQIGVNLNVEQETRDLFTDHGNSCPGRHMFASFFDSENQVIVDLKVVLAN